MKYYNLHQKTVDEAETKKFILNHYNGIIKKGSRYRDVFSVQILSDKKDFLKINEQAYLKTKDYVPARDPKTFYKLLVSLRFKYENHIMSEGIPFLQKYIKLNYDIQI